VLPKPADAESVEDVWIEEALTRGLPVPPNLELAYRQRQARKRGLTTDTKETFHEFVRRLNPTLLDFEHVPKLIDVGQRIVDGVLDRVIVMLPPRYLKTEIFSKLLSAYYLLTHTMRHVAVTSYVARLAWDISAASRELFRRGGGLVSEESAAKDRWVTDKNGELWAIGMGGMLLGRGYHFGLVDDPIQPQKARSPHFRELFEDWWPNTWLSRQERGHGQIAVVMQRLGPEDPIDFLYRREVGERTQAAPERWHVVCMDEIKSDEPLGRWSGPRGLPPTCTVEPDERPKGQVLSPTWIPKETVLQAQAGAGPLTTAAQRQQRPVAAQGIFWKVEWFSEYQVLPEDAHDGGLDWDTAYGEGGADTAWVRSYRGVANRDTPDLFDIYIDDCGWEDLEFPALVERMRLLKGPHFIEEKASGKSAAQSVKTYGIPVKEVTVKGDKLARASAAQPAVTTGRVFINAKISQKLLWGEGQGLLRVSAEALREGAKGLDLNDAFVQAIHRHLGLSEEKRRVIMR
jgi:phage terminase large subunit-like protein